MKKNIQVLFFGKLKDTWNTHSMSIQTNCETIENLYNELITTITEIPFKASIKVAINDEFVDWNSHITDGDSVAFLPPSSGG